MSEWSPETCFICALRVWRVCCALGWGGGGGCEGGDGQSGHGGEYVVYVGLSGACVPLCLHMCKSVFP